MQFRFPAAVEQNTESATVPSHAQYPRMGLIQPFAAIDAVGSCIGVPEFYVLAVSQ